jgi:hypothetical protein
MVREAHEHPRQDRAPASVVGTRIARLQRELVGADERLDEVESRVPQPRLDARALLVVRRVLARDLREHGLEPAVDAQQRLDLRGTDVASRPGKPAIRSRASFWIARTSPLGSSAIQRCAWFALASGSESRRTQATRGFPMVRELTVTARCGVAINGPRPSSFR